MPKTLVEKLVADAEEIRTATDYILIDNRSRWFCDKPGWYYQRGDDPRARKFGPYDTALLAETAANRATNGGTCVNAKWVAGRLVVQHV